MGIEDNGVQAELEERGLRQMEREAQKAAILGLVVEKGGQVPEWMNRATVMAGDKLQPGDVIEVPKGAVRTRPTGSFTNEVDANGPDMWTERLVYTDGQERGGDVNASPVVRVSEANIVVVDRMLTSADDPDFKDAWHHLVVRATPEGQARLVQLGAPHLEQMEREVEVAALYDREGRIVEAQTLNEEVRDLIGRSLWRDEEVPGPDVRVIVGVTPISELALRRVVPETGDSRDGLEKLLRYPDIRTKARIAYTDGEVVTGEGGVQMITRPGDTSIMEERITHDGKEVSRVVGLYLSVPAAQGYRQREDARGQRPEGGN